MHSESRNVTVQRPIIVNYTKAYSAKDEAILSRLVHWSWIILSFSACLQCIFFWSTTNFIAVECVILGWFITTAFFLHSDVVKKYPFSTFLIFGFTVTQLYLPLLFTLLEGKPLVFNLNLPNQVFLHSMLTLIVLALSHVIYRLYFNWPATNLRSLLRSAGFFQSPTNLQLWAMGTVGLFATFYSFLYTTSGRESTGAAGDKLIESLIPFTYAPFFIPFGQLYGSNRKINNRTLFMLLLFILLLFVVSIGRNSRGTFMMGFTSIGFAYVLGVMLGMFRAQLLTLKNVFIALITLWLFTGPIADLGTSMVMVRTQRTDVSYTELIALTFDTFQDREAIRQYNQRPLTSEFKSDWDENYMDNIFLARFCNIKYNDASLEDAAKVGEQNSEMLQFTIDYFWATLPKPILDALGININKALLRNLSFGDYLHYKASNDAYILGSYVTGHIAGTGMATFGWWYLLLLGLGMIPVYLLVDVLSINKQVIDLSKGKFSYKSVCFSLCGLLALTSIFQFLPGESVEGVAAYLARGWIQMILLYFLLYHFTRMLSNFFLRFFSTGRSN